VIISHVTDSMQLKKNNYSIRMFLKDSVCCAVINVHFLDSAYSLVISPKLFKHTPLLI